MSQHTQAIGPTLVPYFGYRDAAAAIEWLSKAFGFKKTQAFPGPDGTIIHAEMSYGNGVIMLGTATEEQSPQAHSGGPGIYVCVDNVDTHYERAKAAGAKIVYGPEDTDFGTRRYRTLDPEGYEWSFGTYRPSPVEANA